MKRREAIKDKGFCFNCLCTAHTRNFCPSRNKCIVCDQNHHTLIHVDEATSSRTSNSSTAANRATGNRNTKPAHSHRSTPSTNRQSEITRRRVSNTSSATKGTNQPQSHLMDRLSRRAKTHVFLPTALARVLTAKGSEKTRLLFSSGEPSTMIHKKLVDRLQLRTIKNNDKEYCTLNLQSFHDLSAKIQVIGLVKAQFHTNLPKATTEIKLQSVYDHLTDLADPHFFQPKNVDIILGNDYIPKVLKAGIIQTTSTLPMAQSTIFGWVISGACQY